MKKVVLHDLISFLMAINNYCFRRELRWCYSFLLPVEAMDILSCCNSCLSLEVLALKL